jgi:hypothetical protein
VVVVAVQATQQASLIPAAPAAIMAVAAVAGPNMAAAYRLVVQELQASSLLNT